MEVAVALHVEGSQEVDLTLRLQPGTGAEEVARAAAAAAGREEPGPWALYSHRARRWLGQGCSIAESDIRSGDVLTLATQPTQHAISAPIVELVATAGPCAGARFKLGPGRHLVGRGEAAAVRLDDPFIKADHARIEVSGDEVRIADLATDGSTRLDGLPLTGSRALRCGQRIEIGGTTLELRSMISPEGGSRELFNRPPRVVTRAHAMARHVDAPPAEPPPARLPLAGALLPLVLGAATWFFFRSALTLVFLAMSPLMVMGSYIESRLGGRADFRRRQRDFLDGLARAEVELVEALTAESADLHSRFPDLRTTVVAAHRRDRRLWERRPEDPDFLQLRVALASLPAASRVELAPGGSELLRRPAEAMMRRLASIAGAPLTVSLADFGPLGLAGDARSTVGAARWLVGQVATWHSPVHVALCCAVPDSEVAEWDWLKWLPHVDAGSRLLDGPALAAGNADARGLLQGLALELDSRLATIGPYRGTATRYSGQHIVVVLHEDLALDRGTLGRLLADGPRVGIVVGWLGGSVSELPAQCRVVVEVSADHSVTLTLPAEGKVIAGDGRSDTVSSAEGRQLALELAPLRDAADAGGRGRTPRRLDLLDVLDLPGLPAAEDITLRWKAPPAGLRALLGATAAGPLAVDLRTDGPHALVAGTTGAGKSELLQSLVASMATAYPPARVNFLLVDYKGGAAFRQAARLPHTVGVVTDLDAHLARRALVSLRAELRRRERVLKDAGARDLVELEQRDPAGCPPSLVIVIDEFATLVREVPEFVDGIVDLAQRGRSLGLHLVLATQRPGGVVSDSIRANTNLRIALRVAGDAESVDVIGAPEAARIPRSLPGRAFARTGHGELVEFQAPLASAPSLAGPAIEVRRFRFGGAGDLPRSPDARGLTHLERLVEGIIAAHARAGGDEPRRPWLPGLPALLPAQEAWQLGLIDVPEEQLQVPWVLDLERDGNVLVLGGRGSGATSFLRLVAATMVRAPVHLYGIDAAAGDLACVARLPHCGAVVRPDETERLARLMRRLQATVNARRADAHRAWRDEPKVLVLVDNYAGLAAALEGIDLGVALQTFTRLVAEGPAVGVHFVITATRRGAIPAALASALSTRLVLRLDSDEEYGNVGIDPRAVSGAFLPPGRGFLGRDIEVQCAVLGNSGDAAEQVAVLDGLAAAARRDGVAAAPGIGILPECLSSAELPAGGVPMTAAIGLGDDRLAPVHCDLAHGGLLVAGPPRSGRSTALATIANGLRRSTPGCRLVLLAPRYSSILELDTWDEVARGSAGCLALATRLAGELERQLVTNPLVIVADDAEELCDTDVAAALESVIRRGRDRGVRVVAAVETRAAHRAYGGWLAELRKTRSGLLLQPDSDIDGDLLGARLPRSRSNALLPGRGFLVTRGVAELVQVATPESRHLSLVS